MLMGKNLCLLAIAGNDKNNLLANINCLNGLMDNYVIALDPELADDPDIYQALAPYQGELIEYSPHQPHPLQKLLDCGRAYGGHSLYLKADETLVEHTPEPLDKFEGSANVATANNSCCRPLPRLLDSLAELEVIDGLNEVKLMPEQCTSQFYIVQNSAAEPGPIASALTQYPEQPLVLQEYGFALAEQGHYIEALQPFQTLLTLVHSTPEQQWLAHYQLGRLQQQAGFDSDMALGQYLRCIELDEQRIEPHVWAAQIFRQRGRLELALQHSLQSLDSTEPSTASYHEPQVWREQRVLEYLQCNLALGRAEPVIAAAEFQLGLAGHSAAYMQQLGQLRQQAQDLPPAAQASDTAAPCAGAVEPFEGCIPEPTPMGEKRMLCIGMATYDDYDGVYFTIQSIRLHHPEILDRVQFLVIDNNPRGRAAESLKDLENHIPHYRYVPEDKIRSTAIRELLFHQANADFVLAMDCHVLFPPGALAALLDYFSSRPDCNDLIQGPLLHDDNKTVSTHLNFKWVNGMWGDWDKDERGFDPAAPAFEIMSQGCGVFAARKASWPGFNPRARGFGAEEGYIQEKFRQAGQRALCLPALRWLHRFGRPLGPPYKINWADRIRNYMIGWVELGLDTEAIREHFSEQLNAATVDEIIAAIELEMASPLFAIDMVCTLVKPADRQQFEQYQLHQRMVDHSEVGSDLDLRWQTLAHFLRQQSLGNNRHCLIIQDPQNLECLLQAPELKALSEDGEFALWLSPNETADDRLSNTNLLIEQRLFTAVADYLEQAASLSSAELSRETLLQKLGLSTSEPQ